VAREDPKPRQITPADLDPVIHERVRLAIASVLAARREVEYLELRTLLGLTDGNLAGHIRVLEKAGYIEVEKTFVAKKTRTTYKLTAAGRKAFQKHVEVLASLLGKKEDG
jgi:DNA-binding MarR family transcriptional regulator